MARKITVLLGAGASMDAGLPNAYQLTRRVYEQLVAAKSKDAVLYAVVVSKLIARNAKNGQSPFEEINIEEVYDGLKRLLNRDSDLLSEFVSGWDRISTGPATPFDAQNFARSLSSLFALDHSRNFDGRASLKVDQFSLSNIAAELQRTIGGDFDKYRGASLEPFLATLCGILSVSKSDTAYMEMFLRKNADRQSASPP